MTRSLLVTGGAGFIGANFVHYWLARYPQDRVLVLDALTYAGNPANLDPVRNDARFSFVQGDIRDQALVERLLSEHAVDTLVHFAAESHVDRSISGPDAFIETNVIGTHSLLKAARQVWLDDARTRRAEHRFHHVSTDEVYGSLEADDPPFSETTPYAPNSPYSASKAASDHLVRAYHHTYGLKTTTSNCSNNYGPYHYPEKLIPLCITNLLRGRPLPIYGDGRNIRDWLYVEDHCRGIACVLEHGRIGETYNIGGHNEWANIDIIRLLCAQLDAAFAAQPQLAARYPDAPPARGGRSEELIRFVTDRPGHDRRYAIDARKARDEIGYLPAVDFEQGLQRTLAWYLDRRDWWEPLLQA
ncbi:MAG: dTDP-glucose 4,6-dehydratase [Halothiobacillaceae bacterium]|nr:dTDP-glucose 4,6-dehydratase [Halothiobacillaceae bacterium]